MDGASIDLRPDSTMEPGRTGTRRTQRTCWAAVAMTPATTFGWETSDRCDAFTSMTWEPARLAMNSCSGGGMRWSSVPMTSQERIVFQAGVRTFPPRRWRRSVVGPPRGPRPRSPGGRWRARPGALAASGTDPRRRWAGVGEGHEVEQFCGVGAGLIRVFRGEEVHHALTLVGDERVDVDEHLDVRIAGRRVGDRCCHRRSGRRGPPGRRWSRGSPSGRQSRPRGRAAGWVGRRRCSRRPAAPLTTPSQLGAVGPGAIDQDDGGLGGRGVMVVGGGGRDRKREQRDDRSDPCRIGVDAFSSLSPLFGGLLLRSDSRTLCL